VKGYKEETVYVAAEGGGMTRTVGTKHDGDKPAMGYIPPLAILEVGKAFAAGAKKYGAWNYMNGLAATRCVAGALRHTFQFMSGEDYDKETGVHHLACAIANLSMALENVLRDSKNDDRFKGGK
jgi:hypothetical protein